MDDLPPDPGDRKRPHVFTEEVKQRHVSHWDLDYLSSEQLAEAYKDAEPDLPPQPEGAEPIQVGDDYDFIPKEEYDKTAAQGAPKTEDG
jgi:hypothetical protein